MEEYKKSRPYWDEYFKKYLEEMQEESQGDDGESDHSLGCELVENALKEISGQGNVLDFGCGAGWASEYMALNGKAHITAVDYAESAIQVSKAYIEKEGLQEQIDFLVVEPDWLHNEPEDTYDSFFSSNVFDVIAEETANDIFAQLQRVLKKGAKLIICLNAYFNEEMCAKSGLVESSTPRHYLENGVLRLVCRSDEEWGEILGKYFTVNECRIFRYEGESERNKRRMFLLTNSL